MPRCWNLGNTTVRNPHRIEAGLAVFAREFEGKIDDKEDQAAFARRLHEEEVLTTEGSWTDWLGRKWRSVFHKMGFVTGKKAIMTRALPKEKPELGIEGLRYEVTPSGHRLLDAESLGARQDVYLRQLVCHQIPSPIERGFPAGRMKPFIFLLQILHRLRSAGVPGLTKTETAAFIQPFRNHTEDAVEDTLERIRLYRRERKERAGRVGKSRYDATVLEPIGEAVGVQPSTLEDYADTTFRYTRMTGLVGRQGSRLGLREDKIEIIEAILDEEPSFVDDELEYLYEFYRGTSLPTDDVHFALREVERLREELQSLEWTVPAELRTVETSEPKAVEDARYQLLELVTWAREEHFAKNQCDPESVQDIVTYLEDVVSSKPSKPIVDRPSYLEWAVWRALLAIDHIACPVRETRRFEIDDEMHPIHPAPGGGPDLIVEFDDFILVVEVTLTGSSRQLAMEGEPVRRHVADVQRDASKPVYGLFIAPTIDNNTAEIFRIGLWYWEDKDAYLDVVPLRLDLFRQTVEILREHSYQPHDLRNLLEKCLIYRNQAAPRWKTQIGLAVSEWISTVQRRPDGTRWNKGGDAPACAATARAGR